MLLFYTVVFIGFFHSQFESKSKRSCTLSSTSILFLERPDFDGGLILRKGCTLEHVVSISWWRQSWVYSSHWPKKSQLLPFDFYVGLQHKQFYTFHFSSRIIFSKEMLHTQQTAWHKIMMNWHGTLNFLARVVILFLPLYRRRTNTFQYYLLFKKLLFILITFTDYLLCLIAHVWRNCQLQNTTIIIHLIQCVKLNFLVS